MMKGMQDEKGQRKEIKEVRKGYCNYSTGSTYTFLHNIYDSHKNKF